MRWLSNFFINTKKIQEFSIELRENDIIVIPKLTNRQSIQYEEVKQRRRNTLKMLEDDKKMRLLYMQNEIMLRILIELNCFVKVLTGLIKHY